MRKMIKVACITSGLFVAALIQGCSTGSKTQDVSAIGGQGNPADTYCTSVGGKVQPRQNAKGSYSVCSFKDGLQLDTWELYRANHKS
ncbi:DUF333 domain-containing protein [Budviciaceae bacterium CWB-B4]|uniref:DUF333 domain-containing protein n=2 Tax=Limnobaculum xujianqingii TaxID=2738837 RepID=A0A9D7AGQ1_9GAMM|nr:DUF333 domain-containing protein [Limnobaculum xujianqingii]MBK5072371.1 DUF333 domain-containing protein [Limnobaculum xujianqingii]MBK5175680.1 DUF333 domain-containing protein [Limnobaculum xujianqingii]